MFISEYWLKHHSVIVGILTKSQDQDQIPKIGDREWKKKGPNVVVA